MANFMRLFFYYFILLHLFCCCYFSFVLFVCFFLRQSLDTETTLGSSYPNLSAGRITGTPNSFLFVCLFGVFLKQSLTI